MNTKRRKPACSIRALVRGFTLLEVLIALVILSIGLLGLAALQGIGIRSGQGAYLTSQASLLAYDMADRIRANPQTLGTYHGFDTDCGAEPEDPDAALTLADADLAEWACAVENLLPNGAGRIEGVQMNIPGIGIRTTYTITLEWEDLQTEDPDEPWTFTLTFEI